MKLIIYGHYYGALLKFFFRTSPAFWIIIVFLASAQVPGVALFYSDFFSIKTISILAKLGVSVGDSYKFSVAAGVFIAIVTEILGVFLSSNGYKKWAIFMALLFGVLSFSSYHKLFEAQQIWSLKMVGACIFAFVPALASVLVSLLMDKKDTASFREDISNMIQLRMDRDTGIAAIEAQDKARQQTDDVFIPNRKLKVA